MLIKEFTNQSEWDKFQTGQGRAQFLQSWAWGEFQKSLGREPRRLGFYEDEKLLTAAQFFIQPLFFWRYLYGPRVSLTAPAIASAREEFKKQRALLARLELKIPLTLGAELAGLTTACRQPAVSLLLDLSASEEALLAKMHEKTRYNIRLAQKKNLTIDLSGQWPEAWPLFLETARRDKIKIHPAKYYQKMLAQLNDQHIKSWLVIVRKEASVLAAGIFIGYGDTFTYLHGASSDSQRELMAPYLLQWSAISEAKRLGYQYYDFWGVNPADEQDQAYRKSWQGITRFKIGFGGEVVNYGQCLELPLKDVWYNLYQLVKLLRF